MKSLYIVDSPHEQYLPLDKIQYIDPLTNELTGGYWISENTIAPLPNTVMVVIDSKDEFLDALAAEQTHMFFVEDLPDANETN